LADARDGRVRLTVLGGYLGSGKTTWLRHQLHEGQFKDALVIVNEAAGTPVDDALLGGASRLEVLAGGCACCEAREQLIALLRRIADERSRADSRTRRLDRIVLETSGLADPGAIVETIRADPVLVYHIVVSEIVVTVDALHALAELRGEPLGRRQIEVADRLIVTKTDEADPAETKRLLATLCRLNPGAAISGAVRGSEVALPQFADAEPEQLPEAPTEAERGPVFPTKLDVDGTVDWAAFSVWLSALLHARGDDIFRVKGVVRTPAGRLLLQAVRKVMQSPEILPEQSGGGREDNQVVVIGRGYDADELKRSLEYFARAGKN
jgi:G3E family GTPase